MSTWYCKFNFIKEWIKLKLSLSSEWKSERVKNPSFSGWSSLTLLEIELADVQRIYNGSSTSGKAANLFSTGLSNGLVYWNRMGD